MEGACESIAKMRPLMTNMNTKREYTHEDMEELGVVIYERQKPRKTIISTTY